MKERKKQILFIAVLLLTLVGIGYAAIQSNLNINGTAGIVDAKWDIHFENITVTNGSVEINTTAGDVNAIIEPTNRTRVDYAVTLEKPGDFYEFLVDVKNFGTIDGMIDLITSTMQIGEDSPISILDDKSNLPVYLDYNVTYSDDLKIETNHELKAGEKETYKVRVEFKIDINPGDLPTESKTLKFSFKPKFVQADANAVEVAHANSSIVLELGDYFILEPDSNSYKITSDMSGDTTGDRMINPKELTLWRVIDVHNDGSLDAVSEYLASTYIYFSGAVGYANCIGVLQSVAQQYSKAGYTIDTRMMGYDGQTEYISDTEALNVLPSPSTTSTPTITSGIGEEYNNGIFGDNLYVKDYQLVGNIYKSNTARYGSNGLKAYRKDNNQPFSYWLASRRYYNYKNNPLSFQIRYIDDYDSIAFSAIHIYQPNDWIDYSNGFSFRPIITLKSGITANNGLGTIDSPYTLN